MNPTLPHIQRRINYADTGLHDHERAMQDAIVLFVSGIRGPRSKPVTQYAMFRWFSRTPKAFVFTHLTECLKAGRVRMCREPTAKHPKTSVAYDVPESNG